jgi:hypothetical protein
MRSSTASVGDEPQAIGREVMRLDDELERYLGSVAAECRHDHRTAQKRATSGAEMHGEPGQVGLVVAGLNDRDQPPPNELGENGMDVVLRDIRHRRPELGDDRADLLLRESVGDFAALLEPGSRLCAIEPALQCLS